MGFAQEMRDFADGFKTTSSAIDNIRDSREKRADAAARRDATRKPTDADLASQPGFSGGNTTVTSRTPGSSASADPTNDNIQWSDADPHQKALLNTIAGTESGGDYGSHYNGDKITDFSDHPRSYAEITEGPHKGEKSSAAGRYQFTAGTWDSVAKKYGIPDFSPANQDKAAWLLARDTYKDRTGGDLTTTLASGNPGQLAQVGSTLSSQWAGLQTLPGEKFASTFQSNYQVAQNEAPNPEGQPTDGPVAAAAKAGVAGMNKQAGAGGGKDDDMIKAPMNDVPDQTPNQDLQAPVIPMDRPAQQQAQARMAPDQTGMQVASNDQAGWGGAQATGAPGQAYSGITGAMAAPLSPEEQARQDALRKNAFGAGSPVIHAARGGVIPDPDVTPAQYPNTGTPIQQAAANPPHAVVPLPDEGPVPNAAPARPAPVPAATPVPASRPASGAPGPSGVIPPSPLPPEDTHPNLGRESPRFDHTYDQPPAQLRNPHDVVAKALDSGIHFLTDHFGLKQSGAIASPEDHPRIQAGTQRFAAGEGASTPEEIQMIDSKIDPQGQLSGSDKQLQRLTQTMQWYQSQGRGKEGAAAAASLMQYGAQRFGQLGSLAGAAYNHYQQSRDPNDLQATMMYLNKAYELIPDGGAFNIAIDPQTHKIIATHEDADGNQTDYNVTPQELPKLVSSAQDKSAYWQQIYSLADPAGARAKLSQEHQDDRADKRTAATDRRADARQKASDERLSKTQEAQDKRLEISQAGADRRSQASIDAANKREEDRLAASGAGKGKGSGKLTDDGVDYDAVTPLLADAMAVKPDPESGVEVTPEAKSAWDMAASKVYKNAPTKNRAKWMKDQGIPIGSFKLINIPNANSSGSPDDRVSSTPVANAATAPSTPAGGKPLGQQMLEMGNAVTSVNNADPMADANKAIANSAPPPVANASGSPDDRGTSGAYKGAQKPPIDGAVKAKDGNWYVGSPGNWKIVKSGAVNSTGGPDVRSSPVTRSTVGGRFGTPVTHSAAASPTPTPVDATNAAALSRPTPKNAGRFGTSTAAPAVPGMSSPVNPMTQPSRTQPPANLSPREAAAKSGPTPPSGGATPGAYKGAKAPRYPGRGAVKRDNAGVWWHQDPVSGKWDYIKAGYQNGRSPPAR